jgi:ATP-binding cassette subfamily F protein uup
VLHDVAWRLGPGDRIGLLGPNGAGKSTLLRLILGAQPPPTVGFVRRGKTVAPAMVDQRLTAVDGDDRVRPWLERTAQHAVVTTGKELSASQLLESFGFSGDASWQRLADLSGGERRRLELLRVLLTGPNVLLLDEPTNDLDIDTLTVLEDLLDTWPGTLVAVSHDRYFLERVCDQIWVMPGDGSLRHAPGGVEEYLRLRAAGGSGGGTRTTAARGATATAVRQPDRESAPAPGSALDRDLRKAVTRVERALERGTRAVGDLHQQLAAAATDPQRLIALTAELRELQDRQARLEDEWLDLSERLEG